MNKPTKRQAELLKYISEYTTENNVSPSYRDIQSALRLGSVATVAAHIDNCVNAGFLRKVPNAARTLEVIPLKDYAETTQLIKGKISDLTKKLESGEELTGQKAQSINDDILTLRAAAKILDLDV